MTLLRQNKNPFAVKHKPIYCAVLWYGTWQQDAEWKRS